MIKNIFTRKMAILLANIIYIGIANSAVADDSFNSIGGFSLGQVCENNEFSTVDSTVRNPNDVLDEIDVKRKQVQKKIEGGYNLLVKCSIIDNKVKYIQLTAENSDDISIIKESLKEKIGRSADDSEKMNSEPTNLLGNRFDGHNSEYEYWFLSNNRKAAAYTIITIPYGASSISELKWSGGIYLDLQDNDTSEWNYLQQKGSVSSKQQEALKEEKKKERVRGLLE